MGYLKNLVIEWMQAADAGDPESISRLVENGICPTCQGWDGIDTPASTHTRCRKCGTAIADILAAANSAPLPAVAEGSSPTNQGGTRE
jgi:hypothetical protein